MPIPQLRAERRDTERPQRSDRATLGVISVFFAVCVLALVVVHVINRCDSSEGHETGSRAPNALDQLNQHLPPETLSRWREANKDYSELADAMNQEAIWQVFFRPDKAQADWLIIVLFAWK
ncbi:hypothetical protein DM02DRAFT_655124 [Periconia macrospinosa]|uniref:Uncharacterized protein n=1 Tax=Periconia macrospinosa TaxID=97972 RepID=A0A2V1DRN6_9PLEO|nr:hypothetical protein DM02DRAFT_655124 [Periconia macrospinosa]